MKKYCFDCDKDVTVIKKELLNKYTIRGEDILINEEIYLCPYCENEILNDLTNSLTNIYNEYLKKFGLSISTFKQIRNDLNLSQDLFAQALCWSKKTIVRYETGQSLPQGQYLKVYQKLNENKNAIINILTENKKNIKNYETILKKLSCSFDTKTINAFIYFLEDNPLYETQIMKHLFALDFYSCKINNMPITNLKYAHAPYGPIIDGKDNLLNFLIQNKYLTMISNNDDKFKFKNSIEFSEDLFSKDELEILKLIKKTFKNKSSIELSNWSHQFKGWQETNNGQIIDFKYAKYFNL